MKFKVEENAAEVALLELYSTLGDWRRNALEAIDELGDLNDLNSVIDYISSHTVIRVCERARALVEREVRDIIEEAVARERL